jgi:hypothetical protein
MNEKWGKTRMTVSQVRQEDAAWARLAEERKLQIPEPRRPLPEGAKALTWAEITGKAA